MSDKPAASKKTSAGLSRRDFLATATAAGGALLLLGPAWQRRVAAADGPPDPRIAGVMARTIAVDMHNHVYPPGTETRQGWGGGRDDESGPAQSLAQALKRSGLTAVCAAYVLDFAGNRKPGDARDNFLRWLTAIDAQLEAGHIRRALNLKDLQVAHDSGHPTIVQAVEGAQFIEGHLDRVEEVYKRGLRDLQLLHDEDDMVSPLGDTYKSAGRLGGLTPFGAQVIKECNRLGILVDMAHSSHDTLLGALKVATQPFILSHTFLAGRSSGNSRFRDLMQDSSLTKEHAKEIADAGGVVGVWINFVDSLPDFIESIKAMVDAIGVDHVGIGTDSYLLSSRVGQDTSKLWPEMNGGFFPAVVGEMLRQGFTPDEIVKVGGGNFCRVFGKVTSGHA